VLRQSAEHFVPRAENRFARDDAPEQDVTVPLEALVQEPTVLQKWSAVRHFSEIVAAELHCARAHTQN
jgi:hypothetical protein